MAIYVGNQKIKDIYLGSQKIKEVYKGSEMVYSAHDARSYWIHKDTGVKTYFEADAAFIDNGTIHRPPWVNQASEIYLNSDITSIGEWAFADCTSLTTVDIPSATSIGDYVFASCTSLTTVDIPSATSIGERAFASCTSLTTVDIPSATSIGDYVFADCTSLTTVDIGPSIAIIEYNITNNGISMQTVYIRSVTPPTGGWVYGFFDITPPGFQVRVPSASINAYKNAIPMYSNIIVAI